MLSCYNRIVYLISQSAKHLHGSIRTRRLEQVEVFSLTADSSSIARHDSIAAFLVAPNSGHSVRPRSGVGCLDTALFCPDVLLLTAFVGDIQGLHGSPQFTEPVGGNSVGCLGERCALFCGLSVEELGREHETQVALYGQGAAKSVNRTQDFLLEFVSLQIHLEVVGGLDGHY